MLKHFGFAPGRKELSICASRVDAIIDGPQRPGQARRSSHADARDRTRPELQSVSTMPNQVTQLPLESSVEIEPTRRVLIVDDQESVRTLLRDFLEDQGHSCRLAATVAEANRSVTAHT